MNAAFDAQIASDVPRNAAGFWIGPCLAVLPSKGVVGKNRRV